MGHFALALLAVGCGDAWVPPQHDAEAFPLECGHAAPSCESCHPANEPLGPVDAGCESCHAQQLPASHDPETTQVCAECHTTSCGWDEVDSVHPEGFGQPEIHGPAALLHDPAEGACRDCHGEEFDGGSAQSCTACHADAGQPDWLENCTFCHGDATDGTGAPPSDIDGTSDPEAISFRAHGAHVQGGGEYPGLDCNECHMVVDVLADGHWYDDTPGAAEVDGRNGRDPTFVWSAGSCSDSYCHGSGHRDDGAATDDLQAMDCDSCHVSSTPDEMSGFHELHVDDGVLCSECHADTMNDAGVVDQAEAHVDGELQVAFTEPGFQLQSGTCVGSCHGEEHDGLGWGHPPGYEDPEQHGYDANNQYDDCGLCHGEDWTGGSAIGCDDCHTKEGHADWRTDCTFCHGGEGGDTLGLPPQDLDNETDETLISFQAHPEHVLGGGGIGHPDYDCETCHVVPTTALSLGHAVDGTPRLAEVDFGGLAAGSSYASGTCTTWCHGDGWFEGDVNDGSTGLDCDSCHQSSAPYDELSGTHDTHLGVTGVSCVDCHDPVVDGALAIVSPDMHVDGTLHLDAANIGYDPTTMLCTVSCHDYEHDNFGWVGGHPPDYDEPEQHGTDAVMNLASCTGCHGSDLQGGTSGQGCDDCHDVGWRGDCVFCHGGQGGDTSGVPPQDLNNETDETQISFQGHPEHVDGDIHPQWGCETCHGTASASYVDALTDPGHWLDATPRQAEVDFAGVATGSTYGSGSCTTWCHGNGIDDGSVSDGSVSMGCDGCHQSSAPFTQLSGTHATHLLVSGVSCADCHDPVVDTALGILSPQLHVDGALTIDPASTGYDPGTLSCTISCHGEDHAGLGWEGGHAPGYDDPTEHGTDALMNLASCTGGGCHGGDLQGGGSGQGCDDCHEVGWRSDCVFCHGGEGGDVTGLPPQDLDNQTDETLISFQAHPEHADGDTHPLWGCETCHGDASATYIDALTDLDHWLDATPGEAEVDFTGLAAGATYAGTTCSNLYCHGDGRTNGSETDSSTSLGCNDCHGDPPNSGDHGDHEHDTYPCSECHALTEDGNGNILNGDVHVDGVSDVDMDGASHTVVWNGTSCTGDCHGDGHNGENW